MEQEILNHISIINVKNKLNLEEVCSIGDTIYVRCPFCCSEKGEMKLNTANNTYICKMCETRGYSISLFAKIYGITNKEAYNLLIKAPYDLKNNLSIMVNNTRKEEQQLDQVYEAFLGMLTLEDVHMQKLQKLGFLPNEIKSIGFKSIPMKENAKLNICKKLLELGYELKGIPGFYQNSQFKWTFQSHKGFFIPAKYNMKIVGLRIHLDNIYNADTTDIWFSSNAKYNGTKASNNIMLIQPNILMQLSNNEKQRKDIIIATEMLLAYKLYNKFRNVDIIGIPNVISNSELKKLYSKEYINKVYLVLDNHTILHSSESVVKNLVNWYGEDKIQLSYSISECDIPINVIENFKNKYNSINKVA